MDAHPAGSLLSFLAAVPDPRSRCSRRHPLSAIRAPRLQLRPPFAYPNLVYQDSVDELQLVALGENAGVDQLFILLDRHTVGRVAIHGRSGRRLAWSA